MNYNLKIAVDKIKGTEVRRLTCWNGSQMDYVCIPINNNLGTVQNASVGQDGSLVKFRHVYLNLEAVEVRQPKSGTHILIGDVSLSMMQRLTAEQLRKRPILGNMAPWGFGNKNEEGEALG